MEILPDIHWIEGQRSNIYLWEKNDGLFLIDTGLKGDAGRIKKTIEQADLHLGDLSAILITHADADHAGSAAEIQAESGATVYAGEATAKLLEVGKSPKHLPSLIQFIIDNFAGYPSIPPDSIHVLRDGDAIPGNEELKAIATPGHTLDHFSFFSSVQGVLFAGDALNTRNDKLNLSEKRYTADQLKARSSARKLLRLHPATIACGHGRPAQSFDAGDLMMLYRQLS